MKFLLLVVCSFLIMGFVGVASAQSQNEITGVALYVRENPDFRQPSFKYNKATDQVGAAGSYTRFAADAPIGITVEVADTATGSSATDANLATVMAGITLKSRTARAAPFLKGEIGVARLAARNQLLKFDQTNSGSAMLAGGGLDIKLNNAVNIRLLEVEYLGTRISSETVPHFRAGSGLVFSF